jgi:3,4-dihydroxy 2-butanone 4-phosphate synthase/GTP cyclohydrolase II
MNRQADFRTRTEAHHREAGRPFVTLTYAQSLDGCISAAPGTRLQLSGTQSKQLTHHLRASHDAILVGIGTLMSDDPRLTARHAHGPNPQPIILDSQARCPLSARLLQHPTHHLWIAVTAAAPSARVDALTGAGARVVPLPADPEGGIDLCSLLDWLSREGIRSLMVEGGAQVITRFLLARLVDQVILTVAPILVGGVHAIHYLTTSNSHSFPRLRDLEVERLGDDLILWGYPAWETDET